MPGASDLVEALRDPACYGHGPATVEVLQTHISVVCLAGDLVFKLKKAVVLPFLDFGTAERRLWFCREEVRLNRRLCPDVYLGVVPLIRAAAGLRFCAPLPDTAHGDLGTTPPDPPGEVVEHAVLMRRLPEDRMLDRLLQEDCVTAGEIAALARTVATFHRAAERSPAVTAAGAPDRLRDLAASNFAELRALPDHGLPAHLLGALEGRVAADFLRLLPVLRARAARGLVVDGHGDLHARNVCMTEPPAIYDCLEFEPTLRCGDVATENAFLVMDLRYRGRPELARVFVDAYVGASGDQEQPAVLPALVSYRAMVRAKVAAFTARDADLAEDDRRGARGSARRHLHLAAAATAETGGPLWLLLCGPPAGGKSSLAAALAGAAGWHHLATDLVRKELAGIAPTAKAQAEHYTVAFRERTYRELLERAQAATRRGVSGVLLDGNFPAPGRRADARAAAKACGARLLCVNVEVDAATAQHRARARADDPDNTSDADQAVAARLRPAFQTPTAKEGFPILVLDGTGPLDVLAEAVLARLLG